MGELDEKKLEIDYLEKLFFAALAAVFALLGWLASNYESVSLVILVLAFISFLVGVLFVYNVNSKIRKLIREVREL